MEAAREAISRAARNDLVILMADRPALVFEHSRDGPVRGQDAFA